MKSSTVQKRESVYKMPVMILIGGAGAGQKVRDCSYDIIDETRPKATIEPYGCKCNKESVTLRSKCSFIETRRGQTGKVRSAVTGVR